MLKSHPNQWVNSWRTSGKYMRQGIVSSLIQIMACHLRSAIHYDNWKSRSREIGWYDTSIALRFDKHLDSATAEWPAYFQNDWKSLAGLQTSQVLAVRRLTACEQRPSQAFCPLDASEQTLLKYVYAKEILKSLFNSMLLKTSSAKCRQYCTGLNVVT